MSTRESAIHDGLASAALRLRTSLLLSPSLTLSCNRIDNYGTRIENLLVERCIVTRDRECVSYAYLYLDVWHSDANATQ